MMQISCAHCRRLNRVQPQITGANPLCEGCGRELVIPAVVAETRDSAPKPRQAVAGWQLAETQEIELPKAGNVISVSPETQPIEPAAPKAANVISVSQLAETQQIEPLPKTAPKAKSGE